MLSTPEIVLVFVLLILGLGFFTLSEYAIVSSRRSRLKDWASRGNRGAALALELSEEPERFLATIRLGIITLGISTGLYGGAVLVASVSRLLERFPVSEPIRGVLSYGLVAGGLAFATIVCGEVLPRQIAMSRPEWVASRVSRAIRVISVLVLPIERMLETTIQFLLRNLGLHLPAGPPVTEEEIKVLLEEGTKAGVFEATEQQLVERVFRYCDRRAKAIMTPRDQIVWIDMTEPPEEIRRKVMQSPHSRFPVCDQSLDNLLGVVEAKNLLASNAVGEPPRVRGSLSIPLFIYEGTRGSRILEMFRKSTTPVAIVLDEYGSVVGILSHTDILRALVGDVSDRGEEDELLEARHRAGGALVLDGRLPLDEFAGLFKLPEIPKEAYDTLGGFVVTRFGKVPQVGEHLDWHDLRFEVIKMVGKRVDRIAVAAHPADHSDPRN
jgi:putative hemolysin